jgi:phenylacetate-CoA ligase
MTSIRSLRLFHKAAANLPAYKKFLATKGCDPALVNDVHSFSQVPITSKKTYLSVNKHEDLVWKTELNELLMLCSTSGSTGEPYYFPRNDRQAWQGSFIMENFIKQSSYGQGRTLVLLGFGMGVWIGGIITMRSFEIAAARMRAPVAILPTGYNKVEIFKALRKLSPDFDQTIIVGYPPFIKEVVDDAPSEGVNLKELNIRLMFAAEAFTETFRNYLCNEAGVQNPLLDTLNIYGSADLGAMASETPLSILIRKLAREDPMLYQEVFGQIEKTPTLAQYNPQFIDFEEVDGELILTADGALPLIRYAVGDHGGIFEYAELKRIFKRHDVILEDEIEKSGLKIINPQHPFVYVYERKDLSVTLHGIIIYPEYIKEALLGSDITDRVTHRFTMATKHNIHLDQFVKIDIELKKGVKPTKALEYKVMRVLRASMIAKSSEFAEVSKSKSNSDLVHIVLWPNGDPSYFKPGTKQKWVEKA